MAGDVACLTVGITMLPGAAVRVSMCEVHEQGTVPCRVVRVPSSPERVDVVCVPVAPGVTPVGGGTRQITSSFPCIRCGIAESAWLFLSQLLSPRKSRWLSHWRCSCVIPSHSKLGGLRAMGQARPPWRPPSRKWCQCGGQLAPSVRVHRGAQ
jgi:hypothetical protein